MRRYSTLLISIATILVFSISNVDAQKFAAKEGIQVALSKVKEDVLDSAGNVLKPGMVNPELIAVGTLTGKIPNLPIEIELEFDINTGMATVWLYVFSSADDTSDTRAIGVLKLFILYPQEIDLADIGGFPIVLPDEKIDIDKWTIDSDSLAQKLNDDKKFQDYLDTYPNTKLEMLGLGISFDNTFFPPGTITWAGIFSEEDSPRLNCFVNAETGETVCFWLENSVPNEIIEKIEMYPNPFSQFTIINYQLTISGNVVVKVYDVLGNEVAELVNEYLDAGSHSTVFNAVGNSEGMYYYTIRIGERVESGKMMLVR